VVYFSTLYIYCENCFGFKYSEPMLTIFQTVTTRRATKGRIVVTTMTLLYLLGIAQLGIQWYVCCWNFLGNGDTRETVFVSLFRVPVRTHLAIIIASFSMCILADGLLASRIVHFVILQSNCIIDMEMLSCLEPFKTSHFIPTISLYF